MTFFGKVSIAEPDGGGACFNTGTVLAVHDTTQGHLTINSVISHIPVHFPVWQLPKKSTESQTVAQRNALIGATEPTPRGESGSTKRKASGFILWWTGASTVAIFTFQLCLSLGNPTDLRSNEWGLSGRGQSGQFTNYCLVSTWGTFLNPIWKP